MTKFEKFISVITIVIVCLLVVVVVRQGNSFGGVYSTVIKDFSEGISVDGTIVIDGNGNVDAPITTSTITASGAVTAGGLVTTNAGQLESYPNSTSTPASMTLKEADVLNYSTINVSPTGAAADKIFTFFSSSTALNLVPTVGDIQRQCWYNATGTAATTITLAAGTGIDLQTSSSTRTDLTIGAGELACGTYYRQPDTDITFAFTEYVDAD